MLTLLTLAHAQVWNHFDAQECAGQAIGVHSRLDNGVSGFIHTQDISDKEVENPADRVQEGQVIHARITKIDIERFSVKLTCKTSDLIDQDSTWK